MVFDASQNNNIGFCHLLTTFEKDDQKLTAPDY
jgi:hypothetical protein